MIAPLMLSATKREVKNRRRGGGETSAAQRARLDARPDAPRAVALRLLERLVLHALAALELGTDRARLENLVSQEGENGNLVQRGEAVVLLPPEERGDVSGRRGAPPDAKVLRRRRSGASSSKPPAADCDSSPERSAADWAAGPLAAIHTEQTPSVTSRNARKTRASMRRRAYSGQVTWSSICSHLGRMCTLCPCPPSCWSRACTARSPMIVRRSATWASSMRGVGAGWRREATSASRVNGLSLRRGEWRREVVDHAIRRRLPAAVAGKTWRRKGRR